MAITKNIGYAYPTSPLARELGYKSSGYYYLAVYDDARPITRHDVVYACLNLRDVDSFGVEPETVVWFAQRGIKG